MLAIYGTREVVYDIVNLVGKDILEVACYNAKESQVVVGSAKAIAQAEELLKSESRFIQTKAQRLNVTHGFHSRFTEPLLDDLSALAQTLAFNPSPRIHSETCTADLGMPVNPGHLTQHTKDALYFVDAVHRIEERFGACTWIEAGQGSPIVGMIKRAADQRDAHQFYSLRGGAGLGKGISLPSLTVDLWNSGLDVAFWPFTTARESGFKQIWLPPYRFNKTRAWIDNIDRTTEAHKLLAVRQMSTTKEKNATFPASASVLVSLREQLESNVAVFTVHSDTKRFSKIVQGHAVRSRALCPASMYMECATMATQILQLKFGGNTLCFEGVHFESPLGADLTRQVSLKLEQTGNPVSWSFVLTSSPNPANSSKPTVHGKGTITSGASPSLSAYQRLATERAQELESKSRAETLMAKRAYGLFSQVVTYADFLRGISSITMNGRQAVTNIKVPSGHVGENDSTAIDLCDTLLPLLRWHQNSKPALGKSYQVKS